MTEPKTHRTRSGRTLTEEIDALSTEVAETDYDVEEQQRPVADARGAGASLTSAGGNLHAFHQGRERA